MLHVGAELEGVVLVYPREVVAELPALLEAIDERERLAADEREARDVDGDAAAFRDLPVKVVQQVAAGILEQELVDLVIAQQPSVLRSDRRIREALCRGTRV